VGRGRDHDDADLALALVALVKMARNEGFRYDGFWGWNGPPSATSSRPTRRATRGDKGGRVVLIVVA
jgi:hypothetical protein